MAVAQQEALAGHAVPAGRGRIWTGEFVLLMVANFGTFASFQILVPTLPSYILQLGGTEAAVGAAQGVLLLVAVAVRPWLGRMLDRRGRKAILLGSSAIFAASAVLYPWTVSIPLLLAVRAIQGIGWGGWVPAAGTIASDLLPAARRGEGMGYFGLSGNLAMGLAPPVGLFLMHSFGLLPVFVASVALGAVGFLLGLFVPDRHVIQPHTTRQSGGLFERATLLPCVAMGVLTITLGGLVTFVPVDATQRNIGDAGLFFLAYALTLMVARPTAGLVSDRFGPGVVLLPCILISALSLLLLSVWESPFTLPVVAILFGVGFGSVQPVLLAMVINRAHPSRRGAGNAAYFIAFELGIGLGAILLGFLATAVGIPGMLLAAAAVAIATLGLVLATGLHRG